MKCKDKGELKRRFKDEGWNVIAFWPDGRWIEVGTGYGGEQDGNNPIFNLRRSNFYDTTEKERRLMIKAIDEALENDGQPGPMYIYEMMGW